MILLQVTSRSVVCSAHFTAEDYSSAAFNITPRLKPTAVPSVFQWSTTTRKRKLPAERMTPLKLTKKRVKRLAGTSIYVIACFFSNIFWY